MGGSLVVQAAVNQNLAEHAGGAPLWASMLSAFVSGRQLDALSSRGPLKVAGRCTIPWDTLVGLAGRTAGRIQRASASVLVGRLGSTLLFAAIITGQLI